MAGRKTASADAIISTPHRPINLLAYISATCFAVVVTPTLVTWLLTTYAGWFFTVILAPTLAIWVTKAKANARQSDQLRQAALETAAKVEVDKRLAAEECKAVHHADWRVIHKLREDVRAAEERERVAADKAEVDAALIAKLQDELAWEIKCAKQKPELSARDVAKLQEDLYMAKLYAKEHDTEIWKANNRTREAAESAAASAQVITRLREEGTNARTKAEADGRMIAELQDAVRAAGSKTKADAQLITELRTHADDKEQLLANLYALVAKKNLQIEDLRLDIAKRDAILADLMPASSDGGESRCTTEVPEESAAEVEAALPPPELSEEQSAADVLEVSETLEPAHPANIFIGTLCTAIAILALVAGYLDLGDGPPIWWLFKSKTAWFCGLVVTQGVAWSVAENTMAGERAVTDAMADADARRIAKLHNKLHAAAKQADMDAAQIARLNEKLREAVDRIVDDAHIIAAYYESELRNMRLALKVQEEGSVRPMANQPGVMAPTISTTQLEHALKACAHTKFYTGGIDFAQAAQAGMRNVPAQTSPPADVVSSEAGQVADDSASIGQDSTLEEGEVPGYDI
ncbi:uncharacterized protein LOC62_03G003759 [Vanrija pseudolonga]|uniref:Uncharacterized protein n=1 Tax=Vanrija pseudolonga TaxID=143232 RepID=A0AAF1BQ30_9TREE|nr:hypothetical protein LOC62_03G003759 [Vanrija pseudolonga]